MTEPSLQVLTELLVLRAQAGHGDAIGLLLELWQQRLLRHARRFTGWSDDVGDVMQDAWMDIARGLSTLDDPARFQAWAYRIVTRRCALGIRRQQRRREVEHDLASRQSQVSEETPDADVADEVRVALRQLPAEQQAILELRYVEGLNIQQIAEALDLAVGTVKSRLYYARDHMRNILSRELP